MTSLRRVVGALVLLMLAVASGSDMADARVRLETRVPTVVSPRAAVTITGRASGVKRATLELQRRDGRRWRGVALRDARGGRQVTLRMRGPKQVGTAMLRVRARVGRRVVASRRARVEVRRSAGKPSFTATVPAVAIAAAPASPNLPGTVRLSGASDVRQGDVLVAGIGEATPEGLLSRVTRVRRSGANTVLTTTPALITDAFPTGEAVLPPKAGKASFGSHQSGEPKKPSDDERKKDRRSLGCSPGVSASNDLQLDVGPDMKGKISCGVGGRRR